jgi:hypothetical protein
MLQGIKLSTVIIFIFFVLAANCFFFYEHMMPFHWILYGALALIICVTAIFNLNLKWVNLSYKEFIRKITRASLTVNFISIGFVYLACYMFDGSSFEPRAGDSILYHEHGVDLSKRFTDLNFDVKSYLTDNDYSDYGYNVFLGFIYSIFGPYTLVARIINCIFLTFTVVNVFRLTEIIYDLKTAKIAALFTAFSPLLLFFAGVNLKETVMIYLLMHACYIAANIIIRNQNKLSQYLILVLFIILLFFFRTVLGMVFLFSFVFYYLVNMSFKKNSYKVMSVAGLFVALLVVVYYIDKIGFSQKILETFDQSNSQTDAELADKISKGGSSGLSMQRALIVPLLFISVLLAPFSTIVFLDDQVESAWLFSGCLMKNIFVLFALFAVWKAIRRFDKKAMLILSVLILYSLVLSVAAQSTSIRYQLVSLPFIHVFCAAGISNFSWNKRALWLVYLLGMFLAIISWNYFKLSIRGLI